MSKGNAKKTASKSKKTIKKSTTKKTPRKTKKATAKKTTTKKKATKKEKAKTKKTKKSDDFVMDELLVELQSDDEQMILGAIDRLGGSTHPRATELLVECLEDPRYLIRIFAVVNLGERQDKKAVDPLIKSLHDESIFIRQTAAGALENIGARKGLKAIDKAESEGLLLDELPEGTRLRKK